MRLFVGNSESGFSMIETLISMFISLLISAAICLVFVSLYRNIGKVNNEISISREKLVKDKYIRDWADTIEIPYWDTSNAYLNSKIDELKKHDFFNKSIKNIEYLKDDLKCKRGIIVTYTLTNGEEQISIAQFKSYSLVPNEK
ncbi:MAG: hypothetical protein E7060_00785 [Treponema bryantii]|nr:hypothetical protein [Treponema bryantii]